MATIQELAKEFFNQRVETKAKEYLAKKYEALAVYEGMIKNIQKEIDGFDITKFGMEGLNNPDSSFGSSKYHQ